MRTLGMLLGGLVLLTTACGPRVLIVTGTTLGLKATPGDGSSRPPQVTLGYKRAEAAIVPTTGKVATREGADTFSTMSAFDFRTKFFGETELASFVGTGFAVEDIQGNKGFEAQFATAMVHAVPVALQDRRIALTKRLNGLTDAQCREVLKRLGRLPRKGHAPCDDVRIGVLDAQDDATVKTLEDAFPAIAH